MRPLRVLCMDDEPLGRDCVRLALAGVPDAVLVGECGDGEEAVRVIREVRPDRNCSGGYSARGERRPAGPESNHTTRPSTAARAAAQSERNHPRR